MPRGGKRPGAGRKAGSLTARTREIAERALAGELPALTDFQTATPLEVMLFAMRAAANAGHLDDAAKIAGHAAPYIHPKLASIEHTGRDGGPLQIERIERVIVDPHHSNP